MPQATTIVPDFHQIDFSDMQLPMIVVYDHPLDHPEHYVARVFECLPQAAPTNVVAVADTLDALRAKIPPRFVKMQRHPQDEPKIVEAWL